MVLVNPFGLIKYINSTRINAHDVTGAGDTAIAYFGAALANNIEVCMEIYWLLELIVIAQSNE